MLKKLFWGPKVPKARFVHAMIAGASKQAS